jgi:tetratricopeptide (TPR) repeat protein
MNLRSARISGLALALLAGTALLAAIAPLAAVVESRSAMASDASGAIQTAQRQFNSGNYTAAIKTLQSAPQVSTNAEVQYWIGRSYYELRDYDNAITAAEKSVELDAKNSLYHEWLGRIYGGKADRDRSFSYARKVKKEFEEAVRLNPSNTDARRDLEQYSMEAPWVVGGSKDEAKEQVTAIEAIDPVEGHLARAAYDLDAKKPELAEKEYRDVLAAKPKKIEPYFDVLNFFIHQNKPADVEATIQAAALVSPNDPRFAYYRGVSRVLSGTDLPVNGWEDFMKRKESGRKRRSNTARRYSWTPAAKRQNLGWKNSRSHRAERSPRWLETLIHANASD